MVRGSPAEPKEAFARMVLETHGKAVRNYLRRRGVPAEDLEDVLQDIARTASEVRESYDPTRSLQAWLIGVGANVVNHYKRRQARRDQLIPAEKIAAVVDEGPGPEELLIQRDRLAMLDEMMASMPAIQRGVFIQHKLREIPMPAVAKAEGISLDAAWMHCKNAVEHCRSWFLQWRAAERARGRDGIPLVLVPLFDVVEVARRDSARSRYARSVGRVLMRAAAALLALGCMSPASIEVSTLDPMTAVHAGALSTAASSSSAPAPVPRTSPTPAPSSAPSREAARTLSATRGGIDRKREAAEIMVLQAEAELNAGNDAAAIRWLMVHSERIAGGEAAAKRSDLLREIDSR